MSNNNGYPFPTQKQIVAQIANDQAFQIECAAILVQRQTHDELETKSTKYSNRRGLRCSESCWMPALVDKIRNAEEVTNEELDRLADVLPVYRKQLAAHFREEMVANDPALAEKSAVFFTPQVTDAEIEIVS